ncbi:hypothetical protein L596_020803 [Steinernema carpocapsae]|uniref:Uncharacterized protein n=1 Tax=Steinernema carpocapsae TaxID=34508 RepID=A0A4U5MUN3_STECR|nr:hypothetical protein L596_020803 [Steinernema carpocapsae]
MERSSYHQCASFGNHFKVSTLTTTLKAVLSFWRTFCLTTLCCPWRRLLMTESCRTLMGFSQSRLSVNGVAQNNVFARAYRHMDELIKEQQEHGFPPNALRMKLIDARDVDQDELIAHPGVYEAPRCGEMVSVYFTCGPEMDIPQRGYIVYPKKDNHTPFEIRFYLPFIDAFCFPLLYGYGEHSWRSGTKCYLRTCYFVPIGIPYQTEKKQYFERMVEVKKELASKGINIDWSEENTSTTMFHLAPRFRWKKSKECSSRTYPKTEKMFIPLCSLTKIATIRKRMSWKTTIFDDPVETTDSVKIVERGGELYPQRTNANGSEEQMRLLLHDTNDSGDELDFEALELQNKSSQNVPSTLASGEECSSILDQSYLQRIRADSESDDEERFVSSIIKQITNTTICQAMKRNLLITLLN